MCGILGVIGKSKKPEVSYEILTSLFKETESRGKDASGYWCANDTKIIYHKEPTKPTEFVVKSAWKDIEAFNPTVLIAHARESSIGVGSPSINYNNHPFLTKDKQTALIHNGRINEYDHLKKNYELSSLCDSEILLRIFDSSEALYNKEENADFIEKIRSELDHLLLSDENIYKHLLGWKEIWANIDEGKMAVAIGQSYGKNRYLWLSRNYHRPTWVIDMRESLGQVFFCSTDIIWENAINACSCKKQIPNKQKLIEVPTEQLWIFRINDESPTINEDNFLKIKVESECTIYKNNNNTNADASVTQFKIPDKKSEFEIITKLNEKEELPEGYIKPTGTIVTSKNNYSSYNNVNYNNYNSVTSTGSTSQISVRHSRITIRKESDMFKPDLDKFSSVYEDILSNLSAIKTLITESNSILSEKDFVNCLEQLEGFSKEIHGTKLLIEQQLDK